VGMAYVALAAAAVAAPHWAYRDLLRAAAFIIVVYVLMVAIVSNGLQRVTAIGFTVAAFLIMATVEFSADTLPIKRLVAAVFPVDRDQNQWYRRPDGVYSRYPQQRVMENSFRVESCNAVAPVFAGIVGSALATIAYRRNSSRV
jgi:hypothetical protein